MTKINFWISRFLRHPNQQVYVAAEQVPEPIQQAIFESQLKEIVSLKS